MSAAGDLLELLHGASETTVAATAVVAVEPDGTRIELASEELTEDELQLLAEKLARL